MTVSNEIKINARLEKLKSLIKLSLEVKERVKTEWIEEYNSLIGEYKTDLRDRSDYEKNFEDIGG